MRSQPFRRVITAGERSPHLGHFHAGDRVKMQCADGLLTALARAT